MKFLQYFILTVPLFYDGNGGAGSLFAVDVYAAILAGFSDRLYQVQIVVAALAVKSNFKSAARYVKGGLLAIERSDLELINTVGFYVQVLAGIALVGTSRSRGHNRCGGGLGCAGHLRGRSGSGGINIEISVEGFGIFTPGVYHAGLNSDQFSSGCGRNRIGGSAVLQRNGILFLCKSTAAVLGEIIHGCVGRPCKLISCSRSNRKNGSDRNSGVRDFLLLDNINKDEVAFTGHLRNRFHKRQSLRFLSGYGRG